VVWFRESAVRDSPFVDSMLISTWMFPFQLVAGQGVMLTWIGLVNPSNPVALVAGIQAMAMFMDAANGAAYSLVPHVNPQYNGIMSG
jgi:hypothetical protein